MKRCAGLAGVICLFLLCVVVCHGAAVPDAPETSAVSVSRKGKISAWYVEEFTEDYYSVEELTRMAEREAAEHNAAASDKKAAVTVKKVKLLPDNGGKIMVAYRFDSWESYTDFTGESLFYGTVGEAAAKGFGMDAVLKSVADGSLLAGDYLSLVTDRYVIITDVKTNIYSPREVTHISDGAFVNEDGGIDTSGVEGTVYILMK